jgi:hypothetical protein
MCHCYMYLLLFIYIISLFCVSAQIFERRRRDYVWHVWDSTPANMSQAIVPRRYVNKFSSQRRHLFIILASIWFKKSDMQRSRSRVKQE